MGVLQNWYKERDAQSARAHLQEMERFLPPEVVKERAEAAREERKTRRADPIPVVNIEKQLQVVVMLLLLIIGILLWR